MSNGDAPVRMTFQLYDAEVPEPPTTTLWVDKLRWLVMVMDTDDKAFAFVVSCFGYALEHDNGLTPKQDRAISSIIGKITTAYEAGVLDCQINEAPSYEPADDWLASADAEGSA